MTVFAVHVNRGERYWLVHVTGPGFDQWTQARTLADVRPMARDLIESMTDADPAGLDLDVRIDLPAEVRDHLAAAEAYRHEADHYRAQAAAEARFAVRQLRDSGVSATDIAHALGVSKQRVSQLAKAS